MIQNILTFFISALLLHFILPIYTLIIQNIIMSFGIDLLSPLYYPALAIVYIVIYFVYYFKVTS